MEIWSLGGRDRPEGAKNRFLAGQKTNSAGNGEKWKKSASRVANPARRKGGRGGRRGGEEPVEPASPWLVGKARKGKEMGRMEMARGGRGGVGSGEIFGVMGGEGRGGGPRRTWGPLVRAGNFQKARDLVAGDAPGGGRAHLRPLRIFFSLLAPLFFLLERGSLLPISNCNCKGGGWFS